MLKNLVFLNVSFAYSYPLRRRGEKNTVKVPKQPEYASSCLKEIMWDMWDYHREQ